MSNAFRLLFFNKCEIVYKVCDIQHKLSGHQFCDGLTEFRGVQKTMCLVKLISILDMSLPK